MGEIVALPGVDIVTRQPLEVAASVEQLAGWLRGALNRDPFERAEDMARLLGEACQGRALVASLMHGGQELGYVVCELVPDKHGERVLWVRYLVGDGMDLWLTELTTWLMDVARTEGASRIGLRGRKGWVRELKPHGYEVESVEMYCEVTA